MEKYHYRVESGSNCAIYFAHNKYLDNIGAAYHGDVIEEAEYEISRFTKEVEEKGDCPVSSNRPIAFCHRDFSCISCVLSKELCRYEGCACKG